MEFKMDVKITYGIDENPCAKEIRQRVFVQEQGFENEFDEIDKIAWHIVIFSDKEAVATARLYQEDHGFHIGRVAVLKEYRGRGFGEMAVLELEKKAKELNVKEISLSAQMTAKGFYEKMGYKSLEDLHYDEFCPHVTMTKLLV